MAEHPTTSVAELATVVLQPHRKSMKGSKKKRRRGRPSFGEINVGKERVLAATEKLLRTLPPSRVTIARVAPEANAHAKLVSYYFGTRAALLVR